MSLLTLGEIADQQRQKKKPIKKLNKAFELHSIMNNEEYK